MFEFQRRLPHQERKTLANPARGKRATPEPSLAIPRTTGHAFGNQAAQGFAHSCPLRMPTPGRCPFGGVCHTCPVRPQAKLKVSQPGDKYEQEADRVADEVMRMMKPENQRHSGREMKEWFQSVPTENVPTLCEPALRSKRKPEQRVPN